jgi:hypothetical protein
MQVSPQAFPFEQILQQVGPVGAQEVNHIAAVSKMVLSMGQK